MGRGGNCENAKEKMLVVGSGRGGGDLGGCELRIELIVKIQKRMSGGPVVWGGGCG